MRHDKLAILMGLVFATTMTAAPPVLAQITNPRKLTTSNDRLANLEEQLINRLRATRDDQRAYVKFVVNQITQKKLDVRLVFAVERYARRRNATYPFPFFERALRYEANKRGVILLTVQAFQTTKFSKGP